MSIYLLIAVFFWGFSYIAIKASLAYLTPIEIIAARFVLGGITLYLILKLKKIPLRITGQLKTLLISAFILFLHFWVMATGMKTTTATNTAWILTTSPIFISVLSFILLKEPIKLKHILGIILASAGVLALVSKGDLTSLDWIQSTGDWIVLGSSLSWAAYTIVTRKITKEIHPLAATFWMVLIAGLVIVPYSIFVSGVKVYYMPAEGITAILFLGIGCLAISFWAWSEGLAKKPAGEVGLYLYIEPLFAMMGATMLLNEKITIWIIMGGVLIIAAVYISERKKRV
jgi:drug/metabolite transporter (DMT)-like permease